MLKILTKKRTWLRSLILLTAVFAAVESFANHPIAPLEDLTPGDLCEKADEFRYPERIKYCRRAVNVETKWQVIKEYERLGFKIGERRQQFKIDHFIPLCMGGSNRVENLWPQHRSVYSVTDPLEATLCEKLKEGKLRQSEAIDRIRHAKHNLREAARHLAEVRAL